MAVPSDNSAITRKAPPPVLQDYPFGPLLARWMQQGYGLSTQHDVRAWSSVLLLEEMGEARLGKDRPTEGSLRHWRNGNARPLFANWAALRLALTRHIHSAFRQRWVDLLVAKWEAAPRETAARLELYKSFAPYAASMAPLMDHMQEQFDDDVVFAETEALKRLHNTAPYLFDAAQEAARERALGRHEAALAALSAGMERFAPKVSDALQQLDAYSDVLRQRAILREQMDAYEEAVADISESLRMIASHRTDEKARRKRTLWRLVSRYIETIGESADAYRYLRDLEREHGNAPVVPWTILLNLAGSYAEGRQVFDEMVAAAEAAKDASLKPDVVTWSTLAGKVESIADAQNIAQLYADYPNAPQGFFVKLVERCSKFFRGDELLSFMFSTAEASKRGFSFVALEPAIVGYRKSKRFDDALRIILPFPWLPAAEAFLRGSEERKAAAEAYFLRCFGGEIVPDHAHHAAYALFKLYAANGQPDAQRLWAGRALDQAGQPKKRIEELKAFLSDGPSAPQQRR